MKGYFVENIIQRYLGDNVAPASNVRTPVTLFDDFVYDDTVLSTLIGYITAGTGTEVLTLSNGNALLQTGTASGDDVSVRLGQLFIIKKTNIDSSLVINRNKITIFFDLDDTVDLTGFIGVANQVAALTVAPTTVRHAGITWDTSVDGNFRFSTADGTTQTLTATNEALDLTIHKLEITLNGNGTVTLNWYSDATTLQATFTTGALLIDDFNLTLYFFINNLSALADAKAMNIKSWMMELT